MEFNSEKMSKTNQSKGYQTKCRKCGNQFIWIAGLNDGAHIKPDETSEIYFSLIKDMLIMPPLRECRICEMPTVQDIISY
jgi:hypothetical protein